MKKNILVSTLFIVVLSGCNIERLPHGSYSSNKIKEDPETSLEILLNGCYSQLQNSTDVMHRTGEYPGDNVMKQNATTNNFSQYMSYKHTATNNHLPSVWKNGYKIIAQSTNIIKMISEGESKEINQKLGEAYFMRGMMYFYLCRIFGRPYYQEPDKNLGVPIVEVPNDLDNLQLPDRATVKQVYEQVVADLRKAESLMTIYKSPIYISKYAAQALLAKVYAYMSGTYENPNLEYSDSIFYYANKVIEEGPFEMLSRQNLMKYNEFAPDDRSQTETIFAIKRLDSEISNYNPVIGSMYATIQDVGWGEIYASQKLIDLYNETGFNDWKTQRFVDARAAFIHPQYSDNNLRVFRFVHEIYDKTGGLSGYTYKQFEIKEENGNLIAISGENKYELSPIDAPNHRYSISFNGNTYEGVDDFYVNLNNGYPMFYSYKCSLETGIPQLHSPVISRLAEMYLLCAEAKAKEGKISEAKDFVNIVRGRAIIGGEYTDSDFTAENAKELILKERQLELAYEADRGFDVYRIGETMVRRYPGFYNTIWEIEPTSHLVVQLIPQSEINAYPGILTQNPLE